MNASRGGESSGQGRHRRPRPSWQVVRARTAALAALSLGLVGALVTIPTSQANAASIPQPGGGTVTTRFEIDASPNANVTVDGTSPTGGVDWNGGIRWSV